jgi:hypothetical protein
MVTLVPLKTWAKDGKDYYEQFIIYDDLYPSAMMHIDLLWVKDSENELYHLLCGGQTVECLMNFSIPEK